MTDDLITRAENALQGVTDGPWIASKEREARQGRNQGWIYPGNIVSDATKQIVFSQTGNAANSEFIAAARTLVPELVSALTAAQAENERRKHPVSGSIMAWSADYVSDPPMLNLPIGGATYGINPDDASILHHILGEFLVDCAEVRRQREATP